MDRRLRTRLRLESYAFVALLLAAVALAGWLTQRYGWEADWSAGARNSLSAPSAALLATLDQPVSITAFARPDELLRGRIRDLVDRYRRVKPDLRLEMVNPDIAPQRVRELGVEADGTLLVEYAGRSEKVLVLAESALTNALQRLARGGERRVHFLAGHGERDPLGEANHDLGAFGRELQRRGLAVAALHLAASAEVPADAAVLVLAGPQSRLLAGELALLAEYLAAGGNLLWLADPSEQGGLETLAPLLGIRLLPGVIVDATTRLLGIDSPDFALVSTYPDHPVTRDFGLVTLFPRAAGLEALPKSDWESSAVLQTSARAWLETGPLEGEVSLSEAAGDRPGPITLGLALSRSLPGPPAREQRVLVIGDGDFLANAYLGNGGNLDLGLGAFNWLTRDDRFIRIPARMAPDTNLRLGETGALLIGFGFLLVVPLGLAATGLVVWLRRRRR